RYPRHRTAAARSPEVIFAPRSRQDEAEQQFGQSRERSAGQLAAAVGVSKLEADNASLRLFVGQALDQDECFFQKAVRQGDSRVQKQEPFALAEPAAFIDGAREATITAPAAERHAGPAPQSPGERMRRGMVVDDNHFHLATLGARRGEKLTD